MVLAANPPQNKLLEPARHPHLILIPGIGVLLTNRAFPAGTHQVSPAENYLFLDQRHPGSTFPRHLGGLVRLGCWILGGHRRGVPHLDGVIGSE